MLFIYLTVYLLKSNKTMHNNTESSKLSILVFSAK